LRRETLLKTTGRFSSLENTSLSSRITDETAINPIIGIALEVGTSNQELLSQLRDLTVIRDKRSLERVMCNRYAVPSRDQVAETRREI